MELDRVRAHTAEHVNEKLDAERLMDVAGYVGEPAGKIADRIAELDAEWDVERVLEANAASLVLLSVGLGALHSRRWLVLAGVVPAFLLQHAVQGWCPPLEVLRRLGIRTRREIDAERTALKALRGDFDGVSLAGQMDPLSAAELALAAAGRR